MKEGSLLKISIFCALAGLALLYFISQNIELKETDIGKISPDDIGKTVKICGEINSKYISKTNHVFFSLQDDTDTIDVVVFNNTAKDIGAYEIEVKDDVCITGIVEEYKNKLEILPQIIER